MTTIEFCQNVGLTPRELQNWIENGLLEAELVVIPGGRRWEFTAGQAERARVIKALHMKGVTLSQLARADLAFDASQAFVIFAAASSGPAETPSQRSPQWSARSAGAAQSTWPRSARALRNEPVLYHAI
jgi:DNA-binding transcriptional MerR regulator